MERGWHLLDQFIQFIEGEIASSLFGLLWKGVLMATPLSVLIQRLRGKLRDYRETGIVFACLFGFIFIGLTTFSGRSASPDFSGEVKHAITGQRGNDAVQMLIMSITNRGNMQSAVVHWSVEAEVGGNIYRGYFPEMPPSIKTDLPYVGDRSPESMTFFKEDDILAVGTHPIQTGAILSGNLFVGYRDIDSSVLKNGAVITVRFQDVLGNKHSASIKTSAQNAVIGNTKGLRTEMSCRGPLSAQPLPQNK